MMVLFQFSKEVLINRIPQIKPILLGLLNEEDLQALAISEIPPDIFVPPNINFASEGHFVIGVVTD